MFSREVICGWIGVIRSPVIGGTPLFASEATVTTDRSYLSESSSMLLIISGNIAGGTVWHAGNILISVSAARRMSIESDDS